MNTGIAQSSIKNLYSEAFSLSPSAMVTMFEIDVSERAFSQGITSTLDTQAVSSNIFRFHNNVKLINTSIFWQGNEYVASPIFVEGFEITTKGSLPTPKLRMSVDEEGIPYLSLLKEKVRQMGDLIGAKLTRVRTMAKFLDVVNFSNSQAPNGFSPDPYAEFPRDVFYIERKESESKNVLEYSLSSAFDVEGVQIPLRRVMANYCPFHYRGEGCLYEYRLRRNATEHGENSVLPEFAPPVATVNDQLISTIISGVNFTDYGIYNNGVQYQSGDFVFIEGRNKKYYYVAKASVLGSPPPDERYWIADQCSKTFMGCTFRYGANGSAVGNINSGELRFGGFPAVDRQR